MSDVKGSSLRVAIIDDDFHDINFAKLTPEARSILNDETSDEYVTLVEYLLKNKLIPPEYKSDEPDSMEAFFSGPEFESWLQSTNHQDHGISFVIEAVNAHRDSLNYQVFQNIRAAFPAPEFETESFLSRPTPDKLKDFDLIFMDVQIKDDSLDTPDKVAEYLHEVKTQYNPDSLPVMVLMSIETGLEQYRHSVRQRAKMSALSFHIMNKSAMNGEHAVDNLRLLWTSTNEHKKTAQMISALHDALSEAFKHSWERTEQLLWNMDAATLHTLYQTIVAVEKMPFDEGMLEMINKHYLHCVEEAVSQDRHFDDVIAHFEDRGNALFPSLASESLDASHNIQASLYMSGTSDSPQQEILPFHEDMKAHDVMSMLPFGAFISEDNGISVGTAGKINITQLCDLSKHITKYDDRYLRFLDARVISESDAIKPLGNFVRVWPIKLTDGGAERMYMRVDSKISSYTPEEILGVLAGSSQTLLRLRPEFVRQLREDLFQKLSSYESQPAYQPVVGLGRPYLVFKGLKSGKVFSPVFVDGQHRQYRAIEKQNPKSMAFFENDMIELSVALSKQMSGLLHGADVSAKEILDCLREGVPRTCAANQTEWAYRCFDGQVNAISHHRGLPTLHFDMVEERTLEDWESENNVRNGDDEDKKP